MGNGAAVLPSDGCEFQSIEKLCTTGYFRRSGKQYTEQYRLAVEKAIAASSLDVLEVLLPAGNAKNIFPLHLAAKFAKLDAVELLISAGFSQYLKDDHNQTPLHYSAKNSSTESVLCGNFLILLGPDALSIRDSAASMPLHCAVEARNLKLIPILLSNGANLKAPNGIGLTAKQLAKKLGFDDVLKCIEEFESPQNSTTSKAVDMERVMQIWDKFFENAMKGLIAKTEEHDVGTHLIRRADTAPKNLKAKGCSITTNKESKSSRHEYESMDSTDYLTSQLFSHHDFDEDFDADYYIWLSWILCYSYGSSGHDPVYFVVSYCGDEPSRWLHEHLRLLGRRDLLDSRDHGPGNEYVSYPETISDACKQGWMVFFDESVNQCFWMLLSTGAVEYYLPLGDDPECESVGLVPYPDEPGWVACDQMCCYQWVFVFQSADVESPSAAKSSSAKKSSGAKGSSAKRSSDNGAKESEFASGSGRDSKWSSWQAFDDYDDKDGDGCSDFEGYFYNRVTASSLWKAPMAYYEQINELGGWQLCWDEATGGLYWLHSETGESAWAEAEEDYG